MTNSTTELWLDSILDNITKIEVELEKANISFDKVFTRLREQYRLLSVLRKVKRRKTVIKGYYRKTIK